MIDVCIDHLRVDAACVSYVDECSFNGRLGLLTNSRPFVNFDETQKYLFQTCLEHARLSELLGPGSALACLRHAESNTLEQTSRILRGRHFVRDDLEELVGNLLSTTDLVKLVTIVERAGLARYAVEIGHDRRDTVRFDGTYRFEHASRNDSNVSLDKALILVADAHVQSISEIQVLLESCARSNEKLLICARGFSDEVLHTLAVNRARRSLEAHALIFPYDVDDCNTLTDIASLVGGDVVSSLKGQLLSTVQIGSLPRGDHVRVVHDVLELNSREAPSRMEVVVRELRSKIDRSDPSVRTILERRLKRISGSSVVVRLRNDVERNRRLECWDVALRTLMVARRGVVDVEERSWWQDRTRVPLVSLAAAISYGRKLREMLEQSAHVVNAQDTKRS